MSCDCGCKMDPVEQLRKTAAAIKALRDAADADIDDDDADDYPEEEEEDIFEELIFGTETSYSCPNCESRWNFYKCESDARLFHCNSCTAVFQIKED